MSFQAKRELLAQVGPRYQEARRTQKAHILGEFIAATGYARKYAIRLLSEPVPTGHFDEMAAATPLRPCSRSGAAHHLGGGEWDLQ